LRAEGVMMENSDLFLRGQISFRHLPRAKGRKTNILMIEQVSTASIRNVILVYA
jgi:hypothetical protein